MAINAKRTIQNLQILLIFVILIFTLMYRKAIILIAIILTSLCVQSQVFFSCTHRDFYNWDNISETFVFVEDAGYDESSLFEINQAETMFSHTTPTMTSAYYIREKEYDEELEVYTYQVKSDVGNSYTYFFDIKNEQVRALIDNDDEAIMVVFTVKKIWIEE